MSKGIEEDPEYKNLKPLHKQFITLVLNGKSITDAYAELYPNASTRKIAGCKGSTLAKKYAPLIDRYKPLTSEAIKQIGEQTISNLTLMAFADLQDMFSKDGKLLPIKKMPIGIRMGITEVEVKGNKVSYKMGGKVKALEILAKVARLTDNVPEVSITIMTEEEKENKIREILVKAVGRDEDGEQ
jgi:hypothetical protein